MTNFVTGSHCHSSYGRNISKYYCFTVTAALQESRGAAQDFRIVQLCAPEVLLQNFFGLLSLAVAGKNFSQAIQDERIIDALGAQFLFNSAWPVTPAVGARARPVPGEALVAGIA